jgi:hypothetical protein
MAGGELMLGHLQLARTNRLVGFWRRITADFASRVNCLNKPVSECTPSKIFCYKLG